MCFLQQARELVVKLIRDKDQGDFRVGRADFGSKMGGSTLDVSDALMSIPLKFAIIFEIIWNSPRPLQVVVPRFAVGIIIGRNGEMIRKIQNDAGVRIQFKQG